MNFEDLREYIPGDNIRDIDWKASSRNRSLLVRRYIAEKKHNIMLIFDTGRKMKGDSLYGENKKKLALMVGGTIGYLATKNGDFVGAMFNNNGLIHFEQFRLGMDNLEFVMAAYDGMDNMGDNCDITKTLELLLKYINRKMIIFLITDSEGLNAIDDKLLDKLRYRNDVLSVCISDAMLSGGNAYQVEKESYIPDFILKNKELGRMEASLKDFREKCNEDKLEHHAIASVTIDNEDTLVERIVELLEKHKDANNR